MTLLALENPEIATSQPPSDPQQSPDTNFTTKKATLPTPPSSSTEAERDIFQILKEEKESISRGLGQEQPISEAPANVYVITDEDIRHSGATDIPTVLRRIPGMEVMQMTGADFNVSARGNNQTAANHLLVLVDGRPIYEYAFGSVFWSLLPVTLPEIKKIEVMKGPSAAIYGFNAFDGVVNIVTKSPQEMRGNTSGALAQFDRLSFMPAHTVALGTASLSVMIKIKNGKTVMPSLCVRTRSIFKLNIGSRMTPNFYYPGVWLIQIDMMDKFLMYLESQPPLQTATYMQPTNEQTFSFALVGQDGTEAASRSCNHLF
jgi:TonB-dependent Receptor Plug Domain